MQGMSPAPPLQSRQCPRSTARGECQESGEGATLRAVTGVAGSFTASLAARAALFLARACWSTVNLIASAAARVLR